MASAVDTVRSGSSPLRSLRTLAAVAAVVTAGASYFAYQNFTPFALLPVGVTVGLLVYVVLGSRRRSLDQLLDETSTDDPRLPGVLTVVFLFASTAAILSIQTGYYTKPVSFYIATAVAAGVLVIRVLFTDAHITNGMLAFLLGLNTFFSNQLAYPDGLNGEDSGFHRRFAGHIYETGVIPGVGTTEAASTQYTGFPVQHLLAASTTHLTGGALTPTYRTVGILGMLLILPLAYLVARELGTREFAVLTVLFVATMEYVVFRAGHPSKMAYSLPLLVLVFLAIIYIYRRKATPEMLPLFVLFSLALIFTHAHTAFVALLMLCALAIAHWLVPLVEPPFARLFELGSTPDELRRDGGEPTDVPSSKAEYSTVGERVAEAVQSRMHVLAVVFLIGFLTQAIYYADFYGDVVEILAQWVDAIFVSASESTRESPRFQAIPTESLLINTIGSGLLFMLVTLGILDFIERRVTLALTLVVWFGGAGVLMAVGIVGDAQFALPNRIYVIAQLTAMGFFAAAGLIYLFSHAERPNPKARNVAVLLVVFLCVGFVFFSTASTIAGVETSPFNDDVPHRTLYSMSEQQAADSFADGTIDEEYYRSAGSFPADDDWRLDYSEADAGTVVYVNEFNLQTGITLRSGPGQIGGSTYAVPDQPRDGLVERSDRLYDNGAVEMYRVHDRATATPTVTAETGDAAWGEYR